MIKAPKITTLDIEPIGPVVFAGSKRAKRLSVTIKSDQTVRVAVPRGVPLKRAKQFLYSKIPWAAKHLERLKELDKAETNTQLPALDKLKAEAALKNRLHELAERNGLAYNKVSIRNQRTRWGSCSSRNSISLNMNLARLPEELRDYVILHELVHTKHKNHSKKFWKEMDKLIGDAKGARKKLKEYRLRTM